MFSPSPKLRSLTAMFAAAVVVACSPELPVNSAAPEPASRLESWSEEENPLSADGRAAIQSFLEENRSSSFVVLRQGKIAFRYGDLHRKHLIHSMRKPLLSLLYGRAIAEELINLDEPLGQLGLAEPGVEFTDDEKTATVLQLLQARSGIYLPAAAETVGMANARPARGVHQPGEVYYYNNWSFNSLGTLYEKRTSRSIYEAFEEDLARPLGMTDYSGEIGNFTIQPAEEEPDFNGLDGFYLTEDQKSRHAAYHFRLSTNDLALIGQMLVQGGEWNGRQVIDKEWIDLATQCHSTLNANIGGGRSLCYGLMWQVIAQDGAPSAFMHTGLGVHMIYVHPGAELVLIHRADTESDDYQPGEPPRRLIGLVFAALN